VGSPVRLNLDAVGMLTQQVPTAEHMFQKPEEQLGVPVIMPPKLTVYRASILLVLSALFQQDGILA